jgi:hypothetical protein
MQTRDGLRRGSDAGAGQGTGTVGRLVLRVGAASAAVLVAAASTASCSLIIDTNASQCDPATVSRDCGVFPGLRSCTQGVCTVATSSTSCKADAECASFADAACAAGVCARKCTADKDCGGTATCQTGGTCAGGGESPCTVNAQCTSLGQYFVCRKSQCVSLVSDLCSTVYATKSPPSAAYLDDTAVFFGAINPTASTSDGAFGRLVEDSIKLAIDDFAKVDGIPGLTGGANRPLVLVGCNDGPNEDQTDRAAHQLIDELGVAAIIGYPFSGNTLTVAQDVTIPENTLLFSPSATSAAITQLEPTDKDLVWRTCPDDDVQAQALTLYFPTVAQVVEKLYALSTVKVGVAHHSDPYGSGLYDTLSSSKYLGSTVDLVDYDYGSSNAPKLGVVTTIVNDAPNVIFVFGFNEGPDQIMTQVERNWTAPNRPFWIFSDGGEVTSLWSSSTMPADIDKDALRQRVSGTVPGVLPSAWPPYQTFLNEFSASSYAMTDGSADTVGPAGAYDILYLLAYSTVMVGSHPLTGPNLVQYGLLNMKKPGAMPVQISRDQIISTFPLLSVPNAAIDITGVSGPLAFDGKGGVISGDIQIWCVPPNPSPGGDPGTAAINSGLYFDSANDKMAGCIATACGLTTTNPKPCM